MADSLVERIERLVGSLDKSLLTIGALDHPHKVVLRNKIRGRGEHVVHLGHRGLAAVPATQLPLRRPLLELRSPECILGPRVWLGGEGGAAGAEYGFHVCRFEEKIPEDPRAFLPHAVERRKIAPNA